MLFDRTQDQSVEVLEVERNRLQNSCKHLQRSNAELQTAVQDVGPDPDFEQAIEVHQNFVLDSRAALSAQIPVQWLLPTGEHSHNSETAGQN